MSGKVGADGGLAGAGDFNSQLSGLGLQNRNDDAMDDRQARAESLSPHAVSGRRGYFFSGEIIGVCLVALAGCIVFSLSRGQDINWDLRNYHYYASYALLNGRLDIDVAPSQLQTWLNPLPSLISYALINGLEPRAASVVLAVLSSVSIVLMYVMTILSLTDDGRANTTLRYVLAALVGVGAFSSPMFLSEVGATFTDVLGGTFVLGGICLLLGHKFSTRGYFLGGLCLGIAVGIKLTNGFYVIGWVVALVVVERMKFVVPVVMSGIGAMLTYLPVGGAWAGYVAMKTGNPFFPAYNDIFRSALYLPIAMVDDRFRPNGVYGALRYLVEWPAGTHPSAEVGFSDVRFTLLVVLALATLLSGRFAFSESVAPKDHGDPRAVFSRKTVIYLTVFFAVSFAVWIRQFGIQRYAVALEQIAPLLVVMMLSLLAASTRAMLIGAMVCVLLVVAGTRSANWGRVKLSQDWFSVRVPSELSAGNTLFVMLGGEPTSYVVPFMPRSDIFVRVEGNMPISPDSGLGQRIVGKIAAHGGDIRTLALASHSLDASAQRLASFGLTVDPADCRDIVSKIDTLRSCLLLRGPK
jgi:hypothetical protein